MKNPFSSRSGMSIRKRMILLLVIVFVPFFLLEAHVFHSWFQTRKGVELQSNLELARAVAINFETFLQGLLRDELALGLALTGSRPVPDKDRDRMLDKLAADNPAIRSLYWIHPSGVVIASSLRSYIGVHLGDRSYFREVEEGRDRFVSKLFIGRVTGKPTFAVSRAVRADNGALLGVVAATIEPDRLGSTLGVHRLADAGVSLIDNTGMHVSRFPPTDYTWEERNWRKLYPALEGSLKGSEVTTTVTSGTTGKRRLAAFVPVSSIGWVTASSRAEEDVTAAVFKVLLPQIGLILLLTLGAAGAAVAFSLPITRSIFKMKEHTEALGRRDIGQIVPEGPRELRTLAVTLNEMAEQVRSREATIHRSRAELQAFYDSSPLMMGMVEVHGDTVIAVHGNKYVAEFFDTTPDQFPGSDFSHLSPYPEINKLWLDAYRRCQADNAPFRFQYPQPHAAAVAWISATVAPVPPGESGHPRCSFVAEDITERIRSEEALREREARYRELVQNANSAIIRWDADGTITFFNEYAQEFFGWSAEEAVGRHAGMLVPEQESTGADLTGLVREIIENPERYVNNVNENICRDGRRVWMTWTNRLIRDEQGRVTGVLAVGSDITALKAAEAALSGSEERFRLVVENLSEGLMLFDEQGMIYQNPASLRIHGFKGPQEMRIMHKDLPTAWKGWDETGRPLSFEEWPLSRVLQQESFQDQVLRAVDMETGREFWSSYNGCPILGAEGRLTLGFITIRDISDRKRYEEHLKASVAEKENLLRELSHRTKNNMQVISGLLKLQATRSNDDRVTNALVESQDRIQAMALVHEKLYNGGSISSLSIKEYAEDLANNLLKTHQGKKDPVRLVLELEEIFVSYDMVLPVGLIINELISNSLKHAFADRKRGIIFLSLREQEKKLELRYKDDGPGLPEGFDISRIETLGLKLVRSLAVHQLRGTIELAHHSGETEFVFRFPLLTITSDSMAPLD